MHSLQGNYPRHGKLLSEIFVRKRIDFRKRHAADNGHDGVCSTSHAVKCQVSSVLVDLEATRAQKTPIVQFSSILSSSGQLRLLIDTGASCSILQKGRLKPTAVICADKATLIKGIYQGAKKSFGECHDRIAIGDYGFKCNFQVIEDCDSLPVDGILGMDFLWDRTVIDCLKKQVRIFSCTESESSTESKRISFRSEFPQVAELSVTQDVSTPWLLPGTLISEDEHFEGLTSSNSLTHKQILPLNNPSVLLENNQLGTFGKKQSEINLVHLVLHRVYNWN